MTMPFYKKQFLFRNPDGSEVPVRGTGDQYFARFEALDGFSVLKDPVSKFFHYAKLSPDGQRLVSSGVRVGSLDPKTIGLVPHLRIGAQHALNAALSRQKILTPVQRWKVRREARRSKLARRIGAGHSTLAFGSRSRISGTYTGLCILIQFPDLAATIAREEVLNFANEINYDGFGNNGSVFDYFSAASSGLVRYTNVVTEYYTAKHKRSYYVDESIDYGERARELIIEALIELKKNGFDFGPLSRDGEKYVRALNVFYAGGLVNNWAEGLWPHSSSLSKSLFNNALFKLIGAKFFDYQITNMGDELTLQTFCHENGHMLFDFPDLYDYGAESSGVGNFCLMGYGGRHEKNPVDIGAYPKMAAGWARRVDILTRGSHVLMSGSNEFFACSNPKAANEYFLLENRQQVGRDTTLPDAGLMLWHVDEMGSNNFEQMQFNQHYECALVQADNKFDLERGVNLGDAGDLFGAPQQPCISIDASSSINWWDGRSSGINIEAISAPSDTMSFVIPGFVRFSLSDSATPKADIDSSIEGLAARYAIVGDFDGDHRTEIAIATEAPGSVGNDFWVLDYDPSTGKWRHMVPSAVQIINADFDCSAKQVAAKFAVVGDFDGDGRDEIAIAKEVPGTVGNDFWVMDYDPSTGVWRHMVPSAVQIIDADFDCSAKQVAAKFAVVGDFDGDGRDEIAIAKEVPGTVGNDFWVMDYDPSTGVWRHMVPSAVQIIDADFDCSEKQVAAKFAVVGDFDGDGRDEIAIAKEVPGTVGNDFWVMDYDPSTGVWRHMVPSAVQIIDADFDCSTEQFAARSALIGDFDGDGKPEIAIAIASDGAVGNASWIVKFDPIANHWRRLCPIAGSAGGADVEFAEVNMSAKFVFVGDFDGDGKSEIGIAPLVDGSGGNDLWLKRYLPR